MSDVITPALAFAFGPFRLVPAQQLLLDGEEPVRLGSRALELLHALVETPGELVSKDDLIARIWPHTSVAESNLKVQVAALRRALGEGRDGRRFVATANGRGYRFVGSVDRSDVPCAPANTVADQDPAPGWTRPIGRDDVIETVLRELPTRRFITIVGPGGIGKTTIARAVANTLPGQYRDGVRIVELAAIREPSLVPGAVAAALGSRKIADGDAEAIVSALRDKAMLIVLDCCEHVLDAVASIAEAVMSLAPEVHVLATSREPLRAKGEVVERLGPLATPPVSKSLTVAEAKRYSAIQLFVERAATAQQGFELSDDSVEIVAEICRRLDGIALAIELAAQRTDAFSPSELLSLLSDRFQLLTQGRRTGLPHHRTLAATIDWSYDLLPDNERAILRRLSVFANAFDLSSAIAVVEVGGSASGGIAAGLGNLVAKSLVQADRVGPTIRYRLFDSTRAYAREKLASSGELVESSRLHACYFLALFGRIEAGWESRSAEQGVADHGRWIDDVRAALDWAFSDEGDAGLGAALTAVCVPLWIRLSFVDECRRCMERALAASWDRQREDGRVEMKLSAALGSAMLQTRGPTSRAREAWRTAAEIAERVGDEGYQLQALWGLCDDHTWRGEHRDALTLARRIQSIAARTNNEAAQISIRRRIATALRYLGELPEARAELESLIHQDVDEGHWTHFASFHLNPLIAARVTLSNLLWLQGLPEQASSVSRQALEEAKATDHAVPVCNAFAYGAIPIALQVGDQATAERWIAEFREHSARHNMPVWSAVGRCLTGILQMQQGRSVGVSLLRSSLYDLAASGFHMRHPAYLGSLASGLIHLKRLDEARAAIDEALEWSNRLEERWCFAELLRLEGELLVAEGGSFRREEAENRFEQSLERSRRQGALALELRAARSLVRLWRGNGIDDADQLRSALLRHLGEGHGGPRLLAALQEGDLGPAVLA